jgi:hypothetical protein
MVKKDAPPVDGVKVRWSYRPDDRSKQGTEEVLPRDLARQKIREGLAVAVREIPEPEEPAADAPALDVRSTRKAPAPRADS